ncbi:MAG: hypothetical protein Q9165_002221 [Trypethelium subeluteriae]
MALASSLKSGKNVPSRPTKLQLVLALTILRSKPVGSTVKEYLGQLRKSISARREFKRGRQRLNGANYWQEQCKLLEAQNQNLRTHAISLERRNACLEERLGDVKGVAAKTPSADHNAHVPFHSASKRNLSEAAEKTTRGSVKKAKTAASPKCSQDKVFDDAIGEDFDALDVRTDGQVIIESMWELEKLYMKSARSHSAIAYHLNRASTAISSLLQHVCVEFCTKFMESEVSRSGSGSRQAPNSSKSLPISDLTQEKKFDGVFHIAARAYDAVLRGLTVLVAMEANKNILGTVVYNTVCMFHDILELISQVIARLDSPWERPSSQARATRSSSANRKSPWNDKIPRSLASFLTNAVIALDSDSVPHQELFEGFMFVLMDRLGKGLYLFTFGRPRADTIEDDLSPSKDSAQDNQARKLMEMEAPYLLNIFERAMSVAARHLGDPSLKTPRRSTLPRLSKKLRSSGKGSINGTQPMLSMYAKERLQQTLVNAVFGPRKGNDNEFPDCLTMPVQPPAPIHPPVPEEQEIATWYTKGLWELLGWDILAKESDC